MAKTKLSKAEKEGFGDITDMGPGKIGSLPDNLKGVKNGS